MRFTSVWLPTWKPSRSSAWIEFAAPQLVKQRKTRDQSVLDPVAAGFMTLSSICPRLMTTYSGRKPTPVSERGSALLPA